MAKRTIRVPAISVERLRELFQYDPLSGLVSRKAPKASREYARKADIASKYREIRVEGERLYVHQVVWALCKGEWATISIDHRDGDKQNNRIGNLRLATWSQQQANQGLMKNNTSGFKGVSWHKQNKKWGSRLSLGNGKSRHLGLFSTKEEAHAAYVAAITEIHGEFARAK